MTANQLTCELSDLHHISVFVPDHMKERRVTSNNFSLTVGVTFPQMCNMLMLLHDAENSRMLIEYSVHTRTVAPKTGKRLLPWRLAAMCLTARVHPTVTLVQLAAR